MYTHQVASGMILVMSFFLITYTFHSTWVTSEAYSSPSIVLSARGGDGSRIIFDDFREAYYWLRHNTPEVSRQIQVITAVGLQSPVRLVHFKLCSQDAKVMSWWDYGYQITAMANRTILVDNNTWNNTHISRVGQVKSVSFELTVFKGAAVLTELCLPCRPWHLQKRRPMRL